MKHPKAKYFVGDFETTVYKGQENTEVWAAACVEMFSDDVKIFHSIGEQFEFFKSLKSNVVCYYHNLKFDGNFWLSYFLINLGLDQAVEIVKDNGSESYPDVRFLERKEMRNNTVSYSISDMGQWYKIVVKVGDKYIEFRDSLKLLPFSVKKIGNSFGTKHKKLDMEYKGFRYAGCEITQKEQEYIANDVLVIKEALEIMFTEGHKNLTIGSCCLAEYKRIITPKTYSRLFPDLYQMPIDKKYGCATAGDYIHGAYRGGWCYLVKGKERKIFNNGTTADVNSLYPSMMSSESGNGYPVGEPTFWSGNIIPDEALIDGKYYFIRIKTRFYIRKNMLPFIQIKNNLAYRATEMLETSDRFNKADGKYYSQYYDTDGNLQEATITMTLTETDFKLLLLHYELVDFEILDGCYFDARIGIFDEYIEKYKKIKLENKGAKRELAKLFLNNLYGKMASSPASNFKVAYVREDKTIGFRSQLANDKQPGYIAVGAAITSYARNFTIRAAQCNYYGVDKPGFIYADTDSIHCDLSPEQFKGIKVHPKNFCCWKQESSWDIGFFIRQKTYIEHVVAEDLIPVEHPYYNVKCAGMPERCKALFIKSVEGYDKSEEDGMTDEQLDFLYEDKEHTILKKRKITDFDTGLTVPGKLLPKRIQGGVLLKDTFYEMR